MTACRDDPDIASLTLLCERPPEVPQLGPGVGWDDGRVGRNLDLGLEQFVHQVGSEFLLGAAHELLREIRFDASGTPINDEILLLHPEAEVMNAVVPVETAHAFGGLGRHAHLYFLGIKLGLARVMLDPHLNHLLPFFVPPAPGYRYVRQRTLAC